MNGHIINLGADYYPEHWPEDRWEQDAKMMQDAGFDTVRLAEFAWVKMEPRAGQFEFEWLIKAIDVLQKYGIKSVIGTPTATSPAWLCSAHPQILRVNEDEQRVRFGNRQQSCINQRAYLDACDRIVGKIAETFGGNESVIGWQIDNEMSMLCYCDECQRQFQNWLQAKYGSLETLEQAWGTIFWSQTYTDWSQIPLPWKTAGVPNPSLALDYRRFFSQCYVDFQNRQIDIIRQHSNAPITHNFMGFWPENINYQQLSNGLDFISWDCYPYGDIEPATMAFQHDTVRGFRQKNYWVMEQMSGPGGWGELYPAPKPGQIRKWSYQSVAHGADGLIYFRWRVSRYGTEQYWHGILNHDGTTNRRYEEIKQTCGELRKIEKMLQGTTVNSEVAFVQDYDSRFAFQYQKSNWNLNYSNVFGSIYKCLFDQNIPADIVGIDKELSRYKLVFAPLHFVMTCDQAQILRDYVSAGGTLVLTYRSAVKDGTSLIHAEALPALLQDVIGATVKEYTSPAVDEVNKIQGLCAEIAEKTGDCSVWLDLLDVHGAEPIAEYSEGFIPGEVAITKNIYGNGKAFYIGTQPDDVFLHELVRLILNDADVEQGPITPVGVEATVRSCDGKRMLFLINHTAAEQYVELGYSSVDVLKGEKVDESIKLDAYGVAVLVG